MSDLAQRYRTDRPVRRRLLVAGVAAVAAAGLVWLVWVMLFTGRPMATSDLISFEVKGEHSADATLSVVRRHRDVEASCLLRAQATDHSIVGELNFTVDSSSPASTTLTRTVRTERKATSVTLLGCTAEGQPRPR